MAATLNEVYDHAVTDSILRNRVAAAIATAAWNIFAEATPVQARIDWAKDAIGNIMGMATSTQASRTPHGPRAISHSRCVERLCSCNRST